MRTAEPGTTTFFSYVASAGGRVHITLVRPWDSGRDELDPPNRSFCTGFPRQQALVSSRRQEKRGRRRNASSGSSSMTDSASFSHPFTKERLILALFGLQRKKKGYSTELFMTMADSLIRKACDRCHGQKLSCKRTGDEACERCVRLKTECKSSPSLRYKKQQQQSQTQQSQPQQLPSAEVKGGNRSPKRRRTAEMNLVRPEAGMCPPSPSQH